MCVLSWETITNLSLSLKLVWDGFENFESYLVVYQGLCEFGAPERVVQVRGYLVSVEDLCAWLAFRSRGERGELHWLFDCIMIFQSHYDGDLLTLLTGSRLVEEIVIWAIFTTRFDFVANLILIYIVDSLMDWTCFAGAHKFVTTHYKCLYN